MKHVACAADAAYAPHAAAMLHSLFACGDSAAYHAHLLHGSDLLPAVRERLDGMVRRLGGRITFHRIEDGDVANLREMGRISRVMWYRVFLPRLLPDVERVLYLDCDTIVMDDPAALWRLDFGSDWLAAVANVFEPGAERRIAALGLGDGRYFNSGVLLMNLAAWREHRVGERIIKLARTQPQRLVWPDQDALNLVCAGRWQALHPRWNCQNSLFFFPHAPGVLGAATVAEAVSAPGILHFEGGELAKPWHYLCKHPLRNEYYRHLAQTPWPVTPPEGRTLTNMLLRPLPMRWLLPTLRLSHRVQRRLNCRATAP